jgi:SAM-dependent methyltransferase
MTFNFYEDKKYAEAYANLEFPGTYYLAFRDFPEIIAKHVEGNRALDFGCGAGRSTRFLKRLGFEVTGVDISSEMLDNAREQDPSGDYRLIQDDDFRDLPHGSFHLILAAFPFDNIPGIDYKIELFKKLAQLLDRSGKIINLVSSEEIYTHEWNSFSTSDFEENRHAKVGDKVRVLNRAIPDSRPVTDIFMTDEAYRDVYQRAGLRVIDVWNPLARGDEPVEWVNETRISPWVIYVLSKSDIGQMNTEQ